MAGAHAASSELVVERNLAVPMRDGVILRADVYRSGDGQSYPVLLMRTPYGKGPQARRAKRFAEAGYIVAVQDVRGRYASEGTWQSFMRHDTQDGKDGYDTVQWAAGLPGSTGKVGTYGGSYNSLVQWRLAAEGPPALAAMAAFSIPARYTDLEGPGTIRPGRRLQWWIRTMSTDVRRRSGRALSEADKKLLDGGRDYWLWFLPWLDLPEAAFEHETPHVQRWLKHPHEDPWKLHEGCKEIRVPVLDIVGWHDHCNGDMLLWRTMVKEAKTKIARSGSRIIIGPWSHAGRGRRRYGKIDFGPQAAMDCTAVQIRWFDHWLKGRQNGVDRDPPVKIFVMGDNRWRGEPAWPLARTRDKILYLTGKGRANTPSGDGQLVESPARAVREDRYVYDPRDPVPTLHGKGSFTIPVDQRPLARRQDILVYQTKPLAKRIEVTGRPTVELYAATSAPDTDWFARLIDVAPDGLARDVSQGQIRARYRHGLDKPALLDPGTAVKYTISMNATSNAFLPGHRIRVDITSSDFPNYDRNHNTAADQNADAELRTAEQTVFHGGDRPTRIILPQVPDPAGQSTALPTYPSSLMKRVTSTHVPRVGYALDLRG